MKNVLIMGAGKSATALIEYLLQQAVTHNWHIYIMDANEAAVKSKIKGYESVGTPLAFDVFDEQLRQKYIELVDIVISLMPPAIHLLVAKDCVALGKHLITASYITDDIKALETDAKNAEVMIMNELGLDPGIDHLSSIKLIQEIEAKGGVIKSYRSLCGGIVAPQSDTNPWHYKITWNPMNVVTAGAAGAEWIENKAANKFKYKDIYENTFPLDFPGYNNLVYYYNRDSIKYSELYHLGHIDTFVRGTIRYGAFTNGWKYIVAMGLTDTQQSITPEQATTLKAFTAFVTNTDINNVQVACEKKYAIDATAASMIAWLGMYKDTAIDFGNKSSLTYAEVMLQVISREWAIDKGDADLVLMQHEIEYELDGKRYELISRLDMIGKDDVHTAMASGVGLPIAVLTKLILEGQVDITTLYGVHTPLDVNLSEILLKELSELGISFKEDIKLI